MLFAINCRQLNSFSAALAGGWQDISEYTVPFLRPFLLTPLFHLSYPPLPRSPSPLHLPPACQRCPATTDHSHVPSTLTKHPRLRSDEHSSAPSCCARLGNSIVSPSSTRID
ncbi:hypothetical protein E2C01_006777 [Portunus trituberculatus]|uniref:Uncharacterized protein n=1 Tax=Portunus trituberculatus TaxID=210409 RepID=A0A5B7CZ17_PORTR|nr:hypothetical protein [Portunus trituberculatus]